MDTKPIQTLTRIWITYHDDRQIEDYHLRENETFRLFKGNATDVGGDNINHLNAYYSEMVTLYWVWKNQARSETVGFCHYRRIFRRYLKPKSGECQVMAINYNFNVPMHYKTYHNYQDYYDAIDLLNEKYGEGNKYSQYLLHGNVFIPFCCFIMCWDDFCRLCEWLYPILFALDRRWGLNMTPALYEEKARRDFRYDDTLYQRRAVSFLAERLISCFIASEMRPFCISGL